MKIVLLNLEELSFLKEKNNVYFTLFYFIGFFISLLCYVLHWLYIEGEDVSYAEFFSMILVAILWPFADLFFILSALGTWFDNFNWNKPLFKSRKN